MHLPILIEKEIAPPDVYYVLAWNFKNEILKIQYLDFEIPKSFTLDSSLRHAVKMSRVIFCDGYQVERFIEALGSELGGKILIVGNSDRDWFDFPISLIPKIKAVFLQNSFVDDHRIFTLPIGVENLTYFRNGRARNFGPNLVKMQKIDKVLVGPFSPTHYIRSTLIENLQKSSRVEAPSSLFLDPFSYAKYAAQFAYVASPRGNGEDTHRAWESLYRGTVPVLLKNMWSLSIQKLGIPISLIEAWDSQSIDDLPPFQTFNPAKFEALWWPYWKQQISGLL
jgi:hypothetical protein